jgi:hypothetical protein
MASKIKVDQIQTADGTGTIALQNQLSGMTSASMPTGSVLQVKQAYKTDTFTTTASSDTDITGLSVSITPSSTSSKILVTSNVSGFSHNGLGGGFCIQRDSTKIGQAGSSGSRIRTSFSGGLYTGDASGTGQMHFNAVACYLDSPSSTSALTYKVVGQLNGNTLRVNYEESDADNNDTNRGVSHITVMEIAG